ncbi:MAG TPA: histone deacetylase [Thermoanaerobaculia bacterium]|nr:histone deacetylase [Thermoanaerobaculia bacterium]
MRSPFRTVERWLRRGRRRLLLRPRVDFVYSRRYQLELAGATYDPIRGERILTFLDSAGLLDRRSVQRPEPASFRHLRRVHTDEYLDSLHQPGTLTSVIGFPVPEESADRILETQRVMVGGTLLATHLALESRSIAVNLGGGLHHAFASKGERFCVFNDVAVAIADLRAAGFEKKILVVDLDLHDGDGTRAIFAADPTVHTFSIHNQTNGGMDAVEATIVELQGAVQDEAYLEAVRGILPRLMDKVRPALVFYLAGCDPADDDQIGNWKISEKGMLERDQFVASCMKAPEGRLPLVVVLAGGYGLNAWRYSARFLSALVNRGRLVEPPTTEEITLVRYRQLARDIAPHELTGEPSEGDFGLTADDILPGFAAMHRPRRFLGYYSNQGMELALGRPGVLDRIRSLGFSHPTLEFELDNPAGDTVRLFGDQRKTELLVEARVRIDRATVPDAALLRIEWLLMQNPRARFTPQRPRLPGQKRPGLGMLPDIMALLIIACDRLQLDGVLFVPSHFHTASQGRKYLRFLHPADEAFLRALEGALAGLPLPEATHAVEQKRVVNARTGRFVPWRTMPMVFPVSERLKAKVAGEEYEKQVAVEAAELELGLT